MTELQDHMFGSLIHQKVVIEIASVERNDTNTRCSLRDAFEADDACQSRAFERCVPKSMMHVG